jgi:ABC-type nitrate/sulfonate/bicarbonate transport system substrate-binding protein
VVDGQPFPAARCDANRAAGELRVATNGADTEATARLAASAGAFAALCLDVELIPSTSTANYVEVAAQQSQLAIATSIVELADYAGRNDAQLVAIDILADNSTLYTTAEFVNTHPTAAQDIVRAWRHTVEAADSTAAATPIDIDAAETALDAAQDSINGPIPRAGDLITTSLVDALIDPASSTLIWPEG